MSASATVRHERLSMSWSNVDIMSTERFEPDYECQTFIGYISSSKVNIIKLFQVAWLLQV